MLQTELIPAVEQGSSRLMIVLHGLGDSMDGYRWLPGALRLNGLNYLLVNAPDRYYSGFSWYDYGGNPAPGVQRSREALFEIIDNLGAKGFTSEQTVLFGFSQGCLMTLDVGLRYPKPFAGLVGVSGYVHEPEQLVRELASCAVQQRVLMTHGTRDPLIPLVAAKADMTILAAAGIRIEWREFDKEHTIDGGEEIGAIRKFVTACYGNL